MEPCWHQFVIQKSHLPDEEYQNHIIKKMNSESPDPIHENYERDYLMHMPLDVDEYYDDILNSILNCEHNESCGNVEESIQTYIITNIYNTITQTRYSTICKLKATRIIIELMKISDQFVSRPIYRSCLDLFFEIFQRNNALVPVEEVKQCISSIISYVKPMDVENVMFCTAIRLLMQIAVFATVEIITHVNFSQDDLASSTVDVYILKQVTKLIFNKDKKYNTMIIYKNLFIPYSVPTHLSIKSEIVRYAQSNVLLYVRYLTENLDEIEKNKLVMACISYIGEDEFHAHRKFVSILLIFDEKRVKYFIKKLSTMLVSKSHVEFVPQIIKLVIALVDAFHTEKVDLKYHVHLQLCIVNLIKLLRHPVLHQVALSHLGLLCSTPNRLFEHFVATLPSSFTQNRNVVSGIVDALSRLVVHNSANNQMIFNIFFYFMLQRDAEIVEPYCAAFIGALTNFSNAFGLKTMILKFHEWFFTFMCRGRYSICRAIIKLLLNFALSNDASCKDYLKHLYKCLAQSPIVNGIQYPMGAYAMYLLENKPDFIELMAALRAHNIIKEDDVNHLFGIIRPTSLNEVKVLAYFVEYSPNPLSHMLHVLNYILCVSDDTIFTIIYGPLFNAINVLLQTSSGRTFTPIINQKLDILHSLISDHLQIQDVHISLFQVVYQTWMNLANVLNVSNEQILLNLKMVYYIKLERCLMMPRESYIPICYATEFLLASGLKPTERLLTAIYNKLTNELPADSNQHSKWMPLLVFYVDCAYKIPNIRPKAVTCCRTAILTADPPIITYLSILTYFNFCDEVVKEYTDITNILFKQIEKIPDGDALKLYLQLIDRLVEKDYLKLTCDQFFKFVAPLTNNLFHTKTKGVLVKNLLRNSNLVARYFISTMFYIHNFKDHPCHKIANDFQVFLPYSPNEPIDAYSMYQVLFKSLPVRKQFQILNELADILGDFFKDKYGLKKAQKLICDINNVFQIMVTTGLESPTIDTKLVKLIWVELVRKGQPSSILTETEGEVFPEFFDDIRNLTIVLLKLYHFEHLTEYVHKKVFVTLLYWSKYFIKDLTTLIYHEKNEELFNLYKKANAIVHDEIE